MSKTTQNTASGTPAVKSTESAQAISEAAREWALTVALQKTEWHALKGMTTRLRTFTDPKSGRKFAGVFFACATDDITADNDQFTFFVGGANIDDIVAQVDKL
jgi:hypothetical protein